VGGRTWVTGPYLDISLSGGEGPTAEVTAVGLVDTGASSICCDRRIALHLGLKAVNKAAMELADGTLVEAIQLHGQDAHRAA
jgi:predicted aspartyl protease